MTRHKLSFSRDFGTAARDVKENYEPSELSNPIPWPFIAIALTLAIYGVFVLYLDAKGTQPGEEAQMSQTVENKVSVSSDVSADKIDPSNKKLSAIQGAKLFHAYCATCHQANGAGVRGAVPPLDGAQLVVANSQVPTAIVLKGFSGSIKVKDKMYSGVMPAFHAVLSDEEIALILTHIRTSWSNTAGEVSVEAVASVRKTLETKREPVLSNITKQKSKTSRDFGINNNSESTSGLHDKTPNTERNSQGDKS